MIKQMPNIALGTWTIEEPEIIEGIVTAALKNGYKHIDTAQAYSNERAIGDALKKLDIPREEYWLTSKIHPLNYRNHASHSIKVSLEKLQTGYLDAMLLHASDSRKSNEIAYKEMLVAREQGLIKNIGVSNFGIKQLEALKEDVGEYPKYNQIASSVKVRTIELETFCKKNNIELMGYSSIRPYFNNQGYPLKDEERKIIDELAAKYNVGPALILLSYVSQNGYVILPQSTKPARVIQNFGVTNIKLTDEEMNILNDMVEYGDKQALEEYTRGEDEGMFEAKRYEKGFGLSD
ncbi:aldo/keto reductase [Mycoplasma marinum]|nr:aldo/keto reductase [Mycoplasma marinum]